MKSVLFVSFFGFLFYNFWQSNLWIAPEKVDKIPNPVASNLASIERGRKIFGQVCWNCHGLGGLGNGPASKTLKRKPANFTDSLVQKQTDGAIFWKISEGRAPMAPYKASLTTEQRWHLVNFIRTMKK
ncbi:MAG: cytochrome c [Bacteroidetes bacterium]|nr:cytochrome c [Bacteroidota bacterium]